MKVADVEDEEHICGQCLECAKACQLGLDPMGGKIYPLCHNCGDCIVACRRIKAGGKPLSLKFNSWRSLKNLWESRPSLCRPGLG